MGQTCIPACKSPADHKSRFSAAFCLQITFCDLLTIESSCESFLFGFSSLSLMMKTKGKVWSIFAERSNWHTWPKFASSGRLLHLSSLPFPDRNPSSVIYLQAKKLKSNLAAAHGRPAINLQLRTSPRHINCTFCPCRDYWIIFMELSLQMVVRRLWAWPRNLRR